MRLLEICCTHFRCLESVRWRPGAGLNVIRGENAQGKTSLLEAILFCATSKSHRTNNESDLVAHGNDAFQVTIEVERRDRRVAIACHWHAGAKRFHVNGVAQARLSELLGKVGVVLFSPDDIELVKGGAGLRRRYLDMELSQVSPPYLQALQRYRQAMRQRNELLRRGVGDTALLGPWEEQLAAHATVILELRAEFVEELSALAAEQYDAIAQREGLRLHYAPDVESGPALLEAYARGRESDLRRKLTQRGPHRDDIDIVLEDQPARARASQGQQKSIALAIKFAEVNLVRSRLGEYPILMLDEVLAELDAKRAERLLGAIAPEVQCLMTTTQVDAAPLLPGRSAMDFRMRGGAIEPALTAET